MMNIRQSVAAGVRTKPITVFQVYLSSDHGLARVRVSPVES
jgi:hypothetical protein